MSIKDRWVRLVLAIILGSLYYGEVLTGIFGTVALIVAGILAITSFINFCPLYGILGIKTKK